MLSVGLYITRFEDGVARYRWARYDEAGRPMIEMLLDVAFSCVRPRADACVIGVRTLPADADESDGVAYDVFCGPAQLSQAGSIGPVVVSN